MPNAPTPTNTPERPGADYSIPGMRVDWTDDPADAIPVIVRATDRMIEWKLRLKGVEDTVAPDRVPTTILYRGAYYRIDSEEQTAAGWVYKLVRCPEGELPRALVELSREALLREKEDASALAAADLRDSAWFFFDWIFGWAPSRWQIAWGEALGFDPADASRRQALIQCFVFSGVSALAIIGAVVGGFGDFRAMFSVQVLLFPLLAFEGAGRWLHARLGEQPIGFLPFEYAEKFLYWAFRKVRRS